MTQEEYWEAQARLSKEAKQLRKQRWQRINRPKEFGSDVVDKVELLRIEARLNENWNEGFELMRAMAKAKKESDAG